MKPGIKFLLVPKLPLLTAVTTALIESVLCLAGLYSNAKWQAVMSFPGGTRGKDPTCQCRRQETQLRSLGQADPLEKEMATHSSILAWRIPWTEEPWQPMVHRITELDTTEAA